MARRTWLRPHVDALYCSLHRRAERSGIAGFRPTDSATPPPTAGSPQADPNPATWPMAGWTWVEMLVRYTRAGASERAADEARASTSERSE
ncbi:hypothetical protein Pve01_92420 [Planomonospora venezuelensis]|nr:hypothetical protein Pve01_92420 [Planomonospora venezuelensis]